MMLCSTCTSWGAASPPSVAPCQASHRLGPPKRQLRRQIQCMAAQQSTRGIDLVLSSGFLSFANHAGFLAAMDEPWRGGILSLHKVVKRLEGLLPPTFDQLQREFAVGVVGRDGVYRVVDKGPLAPAVVASAAIPFLFANIDIEGVPGGPFKDGGVIDRIGLTGWRTRRRQQRRGIASAVVPPPAVVHLISRSSPFSGRDDVEAMGERRVSVVRSPKSGVSLWSLGDVQGQFDAARLRAQPAAQSVMERRLQPRGVSEAS